MVITVLVRKEQEQCNGNENATEKGNDKKTDDKKAGARRDMLNGLACRIRSMSSMPLFGGKGMLLWIATASWNVFLLYAAYGASCIAFRHFAGRSLHDLLGFPYRPSSVAQAMKFFAGSLTALSMKEAGERYKVANCALLEFRYSIEHLRIALCASTSDPKLRQPVHIFIAWFMCLMQKDIAFYTEDYSHPLHALVPPEVRHCILFLPEVLWSYQVTEFQFIFSRFMISSNIWNKEQSVPKDWERMMKAYHIIHELLQVRTPTTFFIVGKLAVHLLLITLPLVNGDDITALLLPVLAAVFYAILELSRELADPWGDFGEALHDLPLLNTMKFLSTPSFRDTDVEEIDSTVRWLNQGLQTGDWTFSEGSYPIPREDFSDIGKGSILHFDAMPTLHEMLGFRSWDSFVSFQSVAMAKSEQKGRRLPFYLRWSQDVFPFEVAAEDFL